MNQIETIVLPLVPASTNDYLEVGIATTLSYRVDDNNVLLAKLVENPAIPSIEQYIRQQMEQFIVWVVAKLSLNDMLTSPDIITRETVTLLEQFFAEINTTLITFSLNHIKYPDEITEAMVNMMESWKRVDTMIIPMSSDTVTAELKEMRVRSF
jgi:regulator of protease activity HflC (stomatin/prohibitin superfamily)